MRQRRKKRRRKKAWRRRNPEGAGPMRRREGLVVSVGARVEVLQYFARRDSSVSRCEAQGGRASPEEGPGSPD